MLDLKEEDDIEDDGANVDLDSHRKGKCTVIKTSTRQTIFLPVVGLVDADKLEPGDLVGVNKDSYLILDTLPAEYDSRVKAMEVPSPETPSRPLTRARSHATNTTAPPQKEPWMGRGSCTHGVDPAPKQAWGSGALPRAASRVFPKAAAYFGKTASMQVDEKPSEEYSDIGGLDKQIQEVRFPKSEYPKP